LDLNLTHPIDQRHQGTFLLNIEDDFSIAKERHLLQLHLCILCNYQNRMDNESLEIPCELTKLVDNYAKNNNYFDKNGN